jgi:predicted nucleic acid-binding protein
MSLVLDSSVTIAWIFDDEVTAAVNRVFALITKANAWVPSIWRLEVANALEYATRHKRIGAPFRDASLADLALMKILTDPDTDTYAWTITLQLAERFRLSLYDAAYLELAYRRKLPLASLDKELRRAGKSMGLTLLGV